MFILIFLFIAKVFILAHLHAISIHLMEFYTPRNYKLIVKPSGRLLMNFQFDILEEVSIPRLKADFHLVITVFYQTFPLFKTFSLLYFMH